MKTCFLCLLSTNELTSFYFYKLHLYCLLFNIDIYNLISIIENILLCTIINYTMYDFIVAYVISCYLFIKCILIIVLLNKL